MADPAAIQRAHPEWGIVDAIDSFGGGIWAINARGEVFNLDQAGNAVTDPNVSPWLGGYTTLDPTERQEGEGGRRFASIQRDEATGGYILVSDRGETYNFKGPRTGGGGGAGSALPGALPAGEKPPDPGDSAFINALLSTNDLGGLADWAIGRFRQLGGTPDALETIKVEMQDQPQFKERFPAWEAAQRQGIRTPGQYIDYENAVYTEAIKRGIPTDFVDRQDVASLINGGVSADEAITRIGLASDAAFNAPPDVISTMASWGLDTSALTAYYLGGQAKLPFLQRQFQAAQIGGASRTAGFGALSETEATLLAQQGMTSGQATQAFGRATLQQGLTEELIGETEDLTRSTLLGDVSGDANAAQALERRRAQRTARFEGGGGSSGFGGQRSGLGSAGQ